MLIDKNDHYLELILKEADFQIMLIDFFLQIL